MQPLVKGRELTAKNPPVYGSYFYHSVGGARGAGRHGASRLALPRLRLRVRVLCRKQSSGRFGLRMAVVEPSAKTLGFREDTGV